MSDKSELLAPAFNEWLIETTGEDPELVDRELEFEAFKAGASLRTDRKAVIEAWSKRTGTVECTGEAVPYLKIHFDNVDDMRTFNDAIRALAEGAGK